MRNRSGAFLFLILAISLLASCSQGLFSKVQVKASPTINAALGSNNYLVSKYLSIAEVTEAMNGTEGVKVYSYVDPAIDPADPDDEILKFLVHYPIADFDLDFSTYMADLDIGSGINTQLTNQSFVIPAVSINESASVNFDLNATILASANTGLTVVPLPFVETGSPTPLAATIPEAPLATPGFDSATFSTGSINIAFSLSGFTPGLVLSVTSIELQESDGTLISSTTTPVNIVAGGNAILPLTGRRLVAGMKVVMTGTTSGGTGIPITTRSISITPSLSSDAVITEITGVDFSVPVTIPPVTAPLSADSAFRSAMIGPSTANKITIIVAPLPLTWTGVTRSTDLSIAQTGGLTVIQNDELGDNISVPLQNETINNEDLTIAATTTIIANNATLSGLSGPLPITVQVATAITKLASVTIRPGNLNFEQEFSQDMDPDLQEWVKSIHFNTVGIDLSGLTNGLPAGNDMTLRVSSTTFEIDNQTATLRAGGLTPLGTITNTDYTFYPISHETINFSVSIVPSLYDSIWGDLTLVDITPGTTYFFGGSTELITDWDTATIEPQVDAITGTFPAAGSDPLDLSVITKYLDSNLQFASILVNLYISGLDGLSLDTIITADYIDSNDVLTEDDLLVGVSNSISENLLAGDAFNPPIDITATEYTEIMNTPATTFNLSTILNKRPKTLSLSYSLDPGSINITPSDLTAGSNKLKAELAIILPFAMEAVAPSVISIADMLGEDGTDLFNREPGQTASGEIDDIDTAFTSLTAMTLDLTLANTTGLSGIATLTDWREDPANPAATLDAWTGFKTAIDLGAAQQSITVNKSQIEYMRVTNPFSPQLVVTLPAGNYSVQKNGGINLGITVKATTVVDQTIEF